MGLGDAIPNINRTIRRITVVPIGICGLLYVFSVIEPLINPQPSSFRLDLVHHPKTAPTQSFVAFRAGRASKNGRRSRTNGNNETDRRSREPGYARSSVPTTPRYWERRKIGQNALEYHERIGGRGENLKSAKEKWQ